MIEVYSDGSCSNNPGPGGWAAVIIRENEKPVELSGGEHHTTNNRMELTGAIAGLESLGKTAQEVTLYVDSAYIYNCMIKGWYKRWRKNGWKTTHSKPVDNQDLWNQFLSLIEFHTVTPVKVKGHADDVWNNRCDELAVMQTRKHK